jgi:hypothetical protein
MKRIATDNIAMMHHIPHSAAIGYTMLGGLTGQTQ